MAGMTMRDRMLRLVQGREFDRVPFVQYDGCGGPTEEIWSVVGRENMGILRWTSVHGVRSSSCRFQEEEIEQNGLRGIRTTLHTPAGTLVGEKLCQPTLGVLAVRKHFVSEPEDYAPLIAYLKDLTIYEHTDDYLRIQQELGDDGLPHVALGYTPFQQLWIEWVSIEDLCLHMVDYPALVEECMELMATNQRRVFETVRKVEVPYVVLGDNITAPIIGERYFRRYCVPMYDELAGMLADRNVPVFVHMDGDLKPLWQAIGESGVRGIDSLSPPPDNDTSVAQALAMWPEMRLLVNFPSSVHMAAPERVYEQTMQMLEEGGQSGRLQIQVSENVPPGVWRNSYPQIVRAIADYTRETGTA